MTLSGLSTYFLRRIKLAAFLFSAFLGILAATFVLIYAIREWDAYSVAQRTFMLGIFAINAVTVVVLLAFVTISPKPWVTTLVIAGLLLLQVGGTTAFSILVPSFPCVKFGSDSACRQFTMTAIIGLWVLPGVLFFCTAWLLLTLYVARSSRQEPKTPSLVRSLQDVKVDGWDSAESKERRRPQSMNASPTREPLILAERRGSAQGPFTVSLELAPDGSQWPNVGKISSTSPRGARRSLPSQNYDIASTAEGGEADRNSQLSSRVSVYSSMPLPGTRFRIELRLPDEAEEPKMTSSQEPFPSATSPSSGRYSLAALATAPHRYPNPSPYTRPPFSSSPLTRSFVPTAPPPTLETAAGTEPVRQNPLNDVDRSIRRHGTATTPTWGRMPIQSRSFAAEPASRPLVDKYGKSATITSKTFRDLRDVNREEMRRRDLAFESTE